MRGNRHDMDVVMVETLAVLIYTIQRGKQSDINEHYIHFLCEKGFRFMIFYNPMVII